MTKQMQFLNDFESLKQELADAKEYKKVASHLPGHK